MQINFYNIKINRVKKLKTVRKKYSAFEILIFLVSIYALVNCLMNISVKNNNDYRLFFASIIVSTAMSMMIILIAPGKGVIDLTDSLIAFVFLTLGLQYVVLFGFIYSAISEYLRDKILKRKRDDRRFISNVSMIVVSAYLSGIILNLYFKDPMNNSALYLCMAALVYLILFTVINISIFYINMSIKYGKLYTLKKDGSILILTNFAVSTMLLSLECIIYVSNGSIGIFLIYVLLIVANYSMYIYRKLENRNECIKGLLSITSDIVKYGDFNQKCKFVIENLKKLIPYNVCAIYNFDSTDSGIHVYPVAYNAPKNIDIGELGFELSNRSGIFEAINLGKTYISKDIKNDKKIMLNDKLLGCMNNLMIIPIKINDKIIGMIFIGGKDELSGFMINGINDILDILSNQIALAIENNMIYRNIKNKAEKDQLTKLYNRRIFDSEIRNLIKSETCFSLVIYDIDDFKHVNDTYGHIVGDHVLKNVSDVIMKSIRKTDVACRYGGEEIAIIFKNLSKDDAYLISERIRQEVEGMYTKWYGKCVYVTISGGVSSYPEDGSNIEELIENADRVLYSECKHKGKNRVSVCNLKVISNL